MIVSTIISVPFNLLFSGFWFILDLSYFIGQNLVNQILVIFDISSRLLGLAIKILQVLYKDSVIFLQDVTENISYFIAFVVEHILNARDYMINFSSVLINYALIIPKAFYELINFLFSCVLALAYSIKVTLISLWDGLLLIGNSFWLVVMSIPWGIFYGIKNLLLLLMYLIYGILMIFATVATSVLNGVLNIFSFIYNIPYSSISGLILTFILLYAFITNFKTICNFSFNVVLFFYNYLSTLFYIFCNRYFPMGRNSFKIDADPYMEQNLLQDKLCVICLERLKKVIILPCRHLCLCVYCKKPALQNFRHCPICRGNIEAMMEIYI